MSDEIARVISTDKLNRDQVDQLYPDFPYDRNDPIVKDGVRGTSRARPASSAIGAKTAHGTPTAAAIRALAQVGSAADALPALLGTGDGTGDGTGSNSWVVSGERSRTGKPILANDPHLAPSMPGSWYQMGLHCRRKSEACPFDVSGFTFSGVPGVVIGHNDKISWGFTTMYPDVTDLYLEKVDGRFYEYDGKRLPVSERKETFKVAGQDERESITVRSTRHGPILSDLDRDIAAVGETADPDASYAVSLRWTALRPGKTMSSLFGFNTASSWEEFRGAAKSFEVPSQNLVYADVDGHIGYQAPGLVPRWPAAVDGEPGDGRWPVPGWDPKYDWKGYIPFEVLPSMLDPEEGYIVTANQQVIGPEYEYLLGTGAAAGYRSKRIADLIESKPKLDVADMARMQMDSRSGNAAMLVPRLLGIDVGSTYFREAQDLIDDPSSTWWDNAKTKDRRESRDEVLLRAMRDGRDEMTAKQSRDVTRWRWGNIHRLTLTNQSLGTSGIGVIESIFNRGPYEVAGGGGIVDATGWDARAGYEVTAVPSMRMVVDMADLDRSRWIQLSGQSGHAYSGNYVDQTELWAKGETLPWAFSRKAVDKRASHTLRLASNLG